MKIVFVRCCSIVEDEVDWNHRYYHRMVWDHWVVDQDQEIEGYVVMIFSIVGNVLVWKLILTFEKEMNVVSMDQIFYYQRLNEMFDKQI